MEMEVEEVWGQVAAGTGEILMRDLCSALGLDWVEGREGEGEEREGGRGEGRENERERGEEEKRDGKSSEKKEERKRKAGKEGESQNWCNDPLYFPGVLLSAPLSFWKDILKISNFTTKRTGLSKEVGVS